MLRLYLMPITGAGTSQADPRQPKYTADLGPEWSMMDYGLVPWCIVAAERDDAVHAALTANADVRAVPVDLDSTVGAALSATQTALETARIPAGWVTAGMTWRQVLRPVMGLFQLAQRYHGATGQEIVVS